MPDGTQYNPFADAGWQPVGGAPPAAAPAPSIPSAGDGGVQAGPGPASAPVASGAADDSGDDGVVIVGPHTLARWQQSPPGPPDPHLSGFQLEQAQDDYRAYQQWKAQQGAPPSKETPTPFAVLGSANGTGFGSGSGGAPGSGSASKGKSGTPYNPLADAGWQPVASPAPAGGAPAAAGAAGAAPGAVSSGSQAQPPVGSASAVPPGVPGGAAVPGGSGAAVASSGAAPPPAAPPPPAAGHPSGYLANIGAGANEALAGLLGLPVDVATAGLNLAPEAVNYLAGTHLPVIENPVGGAGTWESVLGLAGADPRNVVAATPGEELARAAARGATGVAAGGLAGAALVPAAAGTALAPVAGGLASGLSPGAAAAGAIGGVTGYGARAAAPPGYGDLADFAGNAIGGGLAAGGEALASKATQLGRNTAMTVGRSIVGKPEPLIDPATGQPFLDAQGLPITGTPGQQKIAGEKLAAASGQSPEALAAAIDAGRKSGITASQPTVGQTTGSLPVLNLERTLRNTNREKFSEAEGANAQARMEALNGLASPTAAGEAASEFFAGERGRLENALASIERAHADTSRRVSEQLGGRPGEFNEQLHGAGQQAALMSMATAIKARIGKLYDAVEGNGKLAMDVQPVIEAYRKVMSEIDEEMGDSLEGPEQKVMGALSKLQRVMLFSRIRTLDSNISAAMREVRNSAGAESRAFRRLSILRDAVSDAMSQAAADAAEGDAERVKAGQLSPGQSVGGKLAQVLEQRPKHAGGAGDFPTGVGEKPGGGLAGGGDVLRGGGAAPAGSADDRAPGGVASLPAAGVAEGAARPVYRQTQSPKAQSLLSYLIARGGIRDEGGELAHMGLTNRTRPTLIRAGGMSHDQMREAMIEGGYLPEDSPNSPNNSDIRQALEMIGEEASGRKQYRPGDAAARLVSEQEQRQNEVFEHRMSVARDRVMQVIEETGERLDRQSIAHAAELVAYSGAHPQEAIEQVARAAEHADLMARNAREGLHLVPGVPDWATQPTIELGGGSSLVPNLTAEDARALRAANAAWKDYKDRFRSGAVGDVLKSANVPSGFKMPASRVAQTFWRKGVDGANAADSLISAAGGVPEAERILGDYPAFAFRRAVEKDGQIDPDAAEKWIKDHQPVLAKFPALAGKFADAASAVQTLEKATAAAKEQLSAYENTAARYFLARNGQGTVEPIKAVGQLFASRTGADDARQLMNMAQANGAASDGLKRAMVDYVLTKFRSASEAGVSGVKELQSGGFQKFVANPQNQKIIRTVLGKTGADVLQDLAADLELQARAVNATRIPGSPGTAADLAALAKMHGGGASVLGQLIIGGDAIGEGVAMLSGHTGFMGSLLRTGGVAGGVLLNQMRAAGMKRVEDLLIEGVLNPEVGKVLLSKARVAPDAPVLKRLGERLAAIGAGAEISSRGAQ